MRQAVAIRTGAAKFLPVFGEGVHITMPLALARGGVSIIEDVSPPGGGPPLHLHQREDELFRVLEGRYLIRCGDETHDVVAGDTILLPRGVPHTFFNPEATPGRLLTVLEPGGFEGFFEEVHAAGLEAPCDFPAIAELGARYGLEFLGPNPFRGA